MNRILTFSMPFVITLSSCNIKDQQLESSKRASSIITDNLETKKLHTGNASPILNGESKTILSQKDCSVLFNDNTWHLIFTYKMQSYDLGRIANTLGYAPEVAINDYKDEIILLIRQTITTFGVDQYLLSFYKYSKVDHSTIKLCDVFKIHNNQEADATQCYEVLLDSVHKSITIEEYLPFKASNKSYTVKKHNCNW